jgi:hypothetical protein
VKRRYIVASTGTVLLQEYQPISCAWKTVVFLKGENREPEAKAWVGAQAEKVSYEVVDTSAGTVVASVGTEEEANKKKRALTRALPRAVAGKGIYKVRIQRTL